MIIAGTKKGLVLANIPGLGECRQLTINVLLDALVGKDRTTINIDFVCDSDIVSQNSHIL